jgi:hypothetical protein
MGASDAASTYLVECYWPAVTEALHAVAVEQARTQVDDLRRAGCELELLGSILIPAEETVFCLFSGTADDVRAASRNAGLPVERVLESITSGLDSPQMQKDRPR